jgi:hypothetical protein
VELVRQALDSSSGTGDHRRALPGEHRTDAGTYTPDPAGHQNHPPGQPQIEGFPG